MRGRGEPWDSILIKNDISPLSEDEPPHFYKVPPPRPG